MTPTTGITHGQELSLVGSGYSPALTLVLAQCGPVVNSIADCDLTVSKFIETDENGGFADTLPAIVGPVGENGAVCDAENSCLIIASEPTPDENAERDEVVITFEGAVTATEAPTEAASEDDGGSALGIILGVIALLAVGGIGFGLYMRGTEPVE